MTDHLETQRLRLRPLAAKDADAITAYYETERAQYTGGHLPRFGAWKNTAFMFGHWQLKGYGLWAVTMKEDDTIVGLVGPFFPDGWPEPEIGWIVFEDAEGQGIAFEAARACLKDARTRLGWTDIVHYIAPENTRSIRLAERLGAELDPHADVPKPDDPCLVYRQPRGIE